MPINFIDRNNSALSLQEFDSTDHQNEVGIPIYSHIVGSVKFEIKGAASYNGSNGTFISPSGYVKITQGNTQKYYGETLGRGITLFIFSGDLHLRERLHYDTYENGNSGLISKLTTINNNFIYILASHDAHPLDNDLKNCLNAQFGCNITTTYGGERRGFALIYANSNCAFQIAGSQNDANACTTLIRYLAFTNFKCVGMSTGETVNGHSFSIHNGITYDSNKTYKVRVRFRTRGDGSSTSSKCSSVGFITWNANWVKSYNYIHYSNTAYNERGKIVDWTYTFRPSSDFTAEDSRIFFIINNGWSNGYDNQTIDLYYYKFWSTDNSGKETTISEAGNGAINIGRYGNVSYNTHSLPSQRVINFIKNNKLYYSVLCSTILDTSYGSENYRDTEPYNNRITTINYSKSTYGGAFNVNVSGNRHLGVTSLTKSYASNNQQVYKRTITYNGNGGSVNPSSYSNFFKTSNPSITVNSSASRSNYSLVRWNSRQDNTGTAYNNGTAYNFDSDTTLYAIWRAVAFSITYNYSGSTNGVQTNNSSNPSTYTVESNTITFANPTMKTGYSFGGWTPTQITKGSSGNKTITGKVNLISYSITYNLNGGTNNSSNPSTYTVESNTITFANPTRSYYTFQGWTLSSIPKGSSGNKSTTATWIRTYKLYNCSANISVSKKAYNYPTYYDATISVSLSRTLAENGLYEPNYSATFYVIVSGGMNFNNVNANNEFFGTKNSNTSYTATLSGRSGNSTARVQVVINIYDTTNGNKNVISQTIWIDGPWQSSPSSGGSE